MKKLIGYHFLANNGCLGYKDGRKVIIGETLSVSPPTIICERGLHASPRILDALQYAPGHLLTQVEVWGDLKEQSDKFVGTHRKTIKLVNFEESLFNFSREVALGVFKQYFKEKDYPVVYRWLKYGKQEDRSAAWSAARSAARSAAWSAARSAARSAAWSATWSAAWSAARSATESATRSAAWSAAWSAARSAQEQRLQELFNSLKGE